MPPPPAPYLIVAGPASHNPDLLAELRAVAARLAARLGCGGSAAAWFDQGRPALADALIEAATQATTIVLVPYLVQWRYPDAYTLPDQARAFALRHPTITVKLAAPIGLTGTVEAALAERAAAALAGPALTALSAAALASLTRREPLGPPPSGGVARPALAHHLLICNGRPCLEAGATHLDAELWTAIKRTGHDSGPERMRLTRTRCLGPCRGAAVVAVYPADDWYQAVTCDQADDLIATISGMSDALVNQLMPPA